MATLPQFTVNRKIQQNSQQSQQQPAMNGDATEQQSALLCPPSSASHKNNSLLKNVLVKSKWPSLSRAQSEIMLNVGNKASAERSNSDHSVASTIKTAIRSKANAIINSSLRASSPSLIRRQDSQESGTAESSAQKTQNFTSDSASVSAANNHANSNENHARQRLRLLQDEVRLIRADNKELSASFETLQAELRHYRALYQSLNEARVIQGELEEDVKYVVELHQTNVLELKQRLSEVEANATARTSHQFTKISGLVDAMNLKIAKAEAQTSVHSGGKSDTGGGAGQPVLQSLVLKAVSAVVLICHTLLMLTALCGKLLAPLFNHNNCRIIGSILLIGVSLIMALFALLVNGALDKCSV